MLVKLQVTNDDINKGEKSSATLCVISQAFKRQFQGDEALTQIGNAEYPVVHVTLRTGFVRRFFTGQKEACALACSFDKHEKINPTELEFEEVDALPRLGFSGFPV